MSPDIRQMVIDRDEVGLERAYFENECPHFFAVDWRGDDADIVEDCAAALGLDSLTAEWRGEDLFILFDGKEVRVPLLMDVADRHITICTLNDVLAQANATAVAENFIDPRQLPNLMTELTDDKLPAR